MTNGRSVDWSVDEYVRALGEIILSTEDGGSTKVAKQLSKKFPTKDFTRNSISGIMHRKGPEHLDRVFGKEKAAEILMKYRAGGPASLKKSRRENREKQRRVTPPPRIVPARLPPKAPREKARTRPEEKDLPSCTTLLVELSDDGCRYPTEDPKSGALLYCGRPAVSRRCPYCDDHHRFIHQPPPKKRRQVEPERRQWRQDRRLGYIGND